METWLASIDPRVIDAWLAYSEIEPQAFARPGVSPRDTPGVAKSSGRMVDAAQAAQRMARRFG